MYKYKVKFVSRVSLEQKGKITFTNKRETNVAAAPLVFELKSEITGRVNDAIIHHKALLY